MPEFTYKREPNEVIDKNKNIFEILRNFKDNTVAKTKPRVAMNTRVSFNRFGKHAARNMPMIKKIQITANGFLFTLKLNLSLFRRSAGF
jgi:hypothetical protein